jgi:hypothetical protein
MSANCPKCTTERRPEHTACARCGLLVSRWAGFRAEQPSHAALDPLWDRLVADWSNAGAHARFVEVATQCDALAIAAARYRSACGDADKQSAAALGIKRLSVLAERMCAQAEIATRPRPPVALVRVAAAAVILSLMVATGVFVNNPSSGARSHNALVSMR